MLVLKLTMYNGVQKFSFNKWRYFKEFQLTLYRDVYCSTIQQTFVKRFLMYASQLVSQELARRIRTPAYKFPTRHSFLRPTSRCRDRISLFSFRFFLPRQHTVSRRCFISPRLHFTLREACRSNLQLFEQVPQQAIRNYIRCARSLPSTSVFPMIVRYVYEVSFIDYHRFHFPSSMVKEIRTFRF